MRDLTGRKESTFVMSSSEMNIGNGDAWGGYCDLDGERLIMSQFCCDVRKVVGAMRCCWC
ncbi:hypothetical protein A2U01_0016680 [Trifolium medium]|uniref:Uncharacterized protein n=1 Tax=Trifolium medium TaxID=97028 RepID=A0A392N927_9FABA|nr:hypothetical protein [Trifolium medium]